MKKLNKLFKQDKNIYQKLNFLKDNSLTHKKQNTLEASHDDKEFNVGLVVIIVIVILLLSIFYYFMIFQPQMQELSEHKTIKINEVNQLFNNSDDDGSRQAILSQINSASSVEDVDSIDVYKWASPIIKNNLKSQVDLLKDKFNRIQLNSGNSTDIMSVSDANKYINSTGVDTLADTSVSTPDTVIIPLSLNRKQAASGLLKTGDVVDIYNTNDNLNSEHNLENNNQSSDNQNLTNPTDNSNNTTNNIPINYENTDKKIVGGATVVSILRSKDSGTVDSNIELNQYPHSRNYTQQSKVDIEQIIMAKSSGTLDESKLKILLDGYGWKLSNYERLANIGDLDCEYIIMLEVPRSNTQELIDNMDSLLLAIPTYDAPDWVKL